VDSIRFDPRITYPVRPSPWLGGWVQAKEKTMDGFESLAHSRWDCQYHLVFIPKGRKKALYGKIRTFLKRVFHELAQQRGCQIVEGCMAGDHVHMCIRIPPKYAVADVRGVSTERRFGLVATRYRPWVLNWRRCRNISATKNTLMNKKRPGISSKT
jgi:REP element-mobilizing transposase RayT